MRITKLESGRFNEPAVVALGNFDGVHLGHQKLLQAGFNKARELNVDFSVLLFDPHPLKILCPGKELELITGKKERLLLFEQLGVDNVFLVQFTPELADTSPQDFVEKILLSLGVAYTVIGFNYTFGRHGKGKAGDLLELGRKYGFGVEVIQAQKLNNKIISSTEIRKYLLNGEIEQARQMMGRSPTLNGTVVHGDARGREIGFPTANLQPENDLLLPKNGVYAVTADINGKTYGGMMNIGMRPTFKNNPEKTIEIHFFDFREDLYHSELWINIQSRIRSERKFKGADEIIRQLHRDREEAITVLSPVLPASAIYKPL